MTSVDATEVQALYLARQLGRLLATLPHDSLVVIRQEVADETVKAFTDERTNSNSHNNDPAHRSLH